MPKMIALYAALAASVAVSVFYFGGEWKSFSDVNGWMSRPLLLSERAGPIPVTDPSFAKLPERVGPIPVTDPSFAK